MNIQNTSNPSTLRVESLVREQLQLTGVLTPEAIELNSQLHGAFADAMGQRLGLQPHEVYEKFPITVSSNTEDFPVVDEGVYGQFAGPNSHSSNLHALADANDKLDKGESPRKVRIETGWFKGPDDMWRYELSDHKAELIHGGLSDDRTLDLGSILQHDELYKAYPELKNLRVTGITNKSYGGMYSPYNDCIEIDYLRPPKHQLSILLHEIQHAIQNREGVVVK